MFFHRKQLMLDVKCQDANPLFGQMLLEQFGGATGELTAALTYWTQSFHVEDPAIRDMLQDIAIEEFSHLEMVGRMIEQHTEKSDARDAAYRSTLFAVRGIGPHLVDSKGQAWTAAYVRLPSKTPIACWGLCSAACQPAFSWSRCWLRACRARWSHHGSQVIMQTLSTGGYVLGAPADDNAADDHCRAWATDTTKALVVSQVILSFVLPVPLITLLLFTGAAR